MTITPVSACPVSEVRTQATHQSLVDGALDFLAEAVDFERASRCVNAETEVGVL